MSELTEELKKNIIEELKFTDEFDEVQSDTPLFNNPHVSLDSIDALRIIVMLQKNYGIKIQDLSQGRKILYSINTIAAFVEENRQPQSNP
ncbi:MAG TPA: acyl carrier protein [Bacteroidales bacterium]|nr:acyl carrier protein [Bacteroidales bacterium]HPS27662.1 acyl carrier protein [Bacteroidales bacterium]